MSYLDFGPLANGSQEQGVSPPLLPQKLKNRDMSEIISCLGNEHYLRTRVRPTIGSHHLYDDKILELTDTRWDEPYGPKKIAIIIYPKNDPIGKNAFNMTGPQITKNLINIAKSHKIFFGRAESLEEVMEILDRAGKKFNLFVMGAHGPGDPPIQGTKKKKKPPSLALSNGEHSEIGIDECELFTECLKRKAAEEATFVTHSCGFGGEGRDLCQKIVSNVEGMRLYASDRSTTACSTYHDPLHPEDVRYFSTKEPYKGQESTMLFHLDYEIKFSGYHDKVVRENYF